MEFFAARPTKTSTPVTVLSAAQAKAWLGEQDKARQAWLKATEFLPKAGKRALLPGADGSLEGVVVVVPDAPLPWDFASLPKVLPKGRYHAADELPEAWADAFAFGWALGNYEYSRYKKPKGKGSKLAWPKGADKKRVQRLSEATFLVRDLITTPANDMGPAELEGAAKELAKKHGAKVTTIVGDNLLKKNYPTVHAVGRASDNAPRLIDLRWGNPKAPKVTLVGKGVCFDSGGLDLKPASGMLLMKKDMGGAAHVLGLAHAIMDAKLKVRLRVLVPAVENSVAGNAFRPMDVIKTRKGLTVEVGNTDAEGRLILCDALAEAAREKPELILDFATLTGAARVALGTEVPALFSSSDEWADSILDAGKTVSDNLWRMPLVDAYERQLNSAVADMSNVGNRFGGAITAALFLRRFVGKELPWVHIDVMAYNNESRPGRPKGGEAMGLRACYDALAARFG